MARDNPTNPIRRARTTRRPVTVLCAAAAAVLMISAPAASADPAPVATDYGGGCVIDPANRAATVDSLRFRCSPEQQDAISRPRRAEQCPVVSRTAGSPARR